MLQPKQNRSRNFSHLTWAGVRIRGGWLADQRSAATDADVAAVRRALNDIGHPGAEVRLAQPGDRGPWQTVMYGIPLGDDACAVSYATTRQHPGRLGAVGALTTGQCLRPAETARSN
jgi:hypothetical protein